MGDRESGALVPVFWNVEGKKAVKKRLKKREK